MNAIRQNRDLFLTVRAVWDLGSVFYTAPQIYGRNEYTVPELPQINQVKQHLNQLTETQATSQGRPA